MKIRMINSKTGRMILKDYGFAVLTILWCIHNKERKLIFASVRFYPWECDIPETTDEHSVQVKLDSKSNRPRLFFRRIKMKAIDALKMYEKCYKKNILEMIWESSVLDGEECVKTINTQPLCSFPEWPYLSVTKRDSVELCPFLPSVLGTCRTAHLLPMRWDLFLGDLISYTEPVAWMEQHLFWNIHDYPELIGSVHLIMPNPICRYVEEKLIPHKGQQTSEQVRVRLVLREKQKIDGMHLYTIERGHFGLFNARCEPVQSENLTIPLAGAAKEFAMVLFDSERGVLDYTDFGYFIRSIRMDMAIMDAAHIVNVPNMGQYSVQVATQNVPMVVGEDKEDDIPSIELGDKLDYRLRQNKMARKAEEAGQRLFATGSSDEATKFVRDMMQKARKRVIIVDPYFATMEFYNYVCAVSSKNVSIQIITSALVLKEKDKSIKREDSLSMFSMQTGNEIQYPDKGRVLWEQVRAHEGKLSEEKISVYVMTGDQPLIHDRFLVIDDSVWFSGNSLNHIGERASMILRVPDPTPVLYLIDKICMDKERIKSLDEWVAHREKG